jgi:hypothetical protein
MKSFNSHLQERKYADREKEPKLSGGKSTIKINPDSESLKEGDYWHPDPDEDRKLSNRGAKLRAREDKPSTKKVVVSTRKLKPGESYMDYAKRKARGESYVPGKPAEKVGALTNIDIPADEREAAKQRLLAKAKARREAMQKEEVEQIDEVSKALAGRVVNARIERTGAAADRENKYRTPQNVRDTVAAADKEARARKLAAGVRARRAANEEFEIEEGMSMKDFKANRKKNERRAASADAEKRGHVGKEWHNTGRKYSPDEAKSGRANMSDYNRQQRYQTAEDPDSDNADTYPAVKTKNPKKLRKQKAMGESLSFSDFVDLCEAEGSYGQTPKAREAMGKLAVSRMRKPASEYSQRGEKTKKLKAAEKHTRRQDRLASGNNRHGSRGPMDQARRNWSRGADDYGHTGYDGEGYGGSVTKNPKKLRKQKAMGEMMSFSQFMEARRMDKEGVDRGDSRRAARAEKAKASLAAVKKGEERKIKVSKKYGIEPSKSDTVEKRAHKRDFAGSRQAPKQKGAKETPQETQNRRINAGNKRRMTHGWTSKEKAANRGMENAGSRFD